MSNTILQTIQQAAQEIGIAGLSAPTSVVSNASNDAVQMLALANALGNDLCRQYDWQRLNKEYRFTTQYLTTTGTWTTSAATITSIPTTAALSDGLWTVTGTGIPQDTYLLTVDSASQVTISQTPTTAATAGAITFSQTKYGLPSDYDRKIDRTDWDKTQHWEMRGPMTAQEWQWLKSGWIATGPRISYRILGDRFQIYPPLAQNDYLGFEYISNQWVLSLAAETAGTTPDKTSFTVDTDTCAFPDRLMVEGLKMYFRRAKGLDVGSISEPGTPVYGYQMQLDLAKANDAGSKTLSFAPRYAGALITTNQIPDSNFGQ